MFRPNIFLDPKSFLNPKTFLAQKLFWPINVFGPKNYFYTQNFHLDKHFFGTKFFLTQKMFRPKFFLTEKDLVWSFGINQPNQILVNQRLSKLNTLDLSLVSFAVVSIVTKFLSEFKLFYFLISVMRLSCSVRWSTTTGHKKNDAFLQGKLPEEILS